MQHESPSAIALAWQDAVNERDEERLLALSGPDIELVGPRGSGFGHKLLRDWLDRAGLSLQTLRVFERGGSVVLWQHGVWRSVETGEVIGESEVASRFRVENRRVTQLVRRDDLDAALAEAGLGYADEERRAES